MAKLLSSESSEEEIIRFVQIWIETLASQKYREAYEMVEHDPYYNWSPELIQKTIEGYGLPEPHPNGIFQVTSPSRAVGAPHIEISRSEGVPPGALAFVSHDLPLNGEWSDLSVTFRLEDRNSQANLVLEEIHVF